MLQEVSFGWGTLMSNSRFLPSATKSPENEAKTILYHPPGKWIPFSTQRSSQRALQGPHESLGFSCPPPLLSPPTFLPLVPPRARAPCRRRGLTAPSCRLQRLDFCPSGTPKRPANCPPGSADSQQVSLLAKSPLSTLP